MLIELKPKASNVLHLTKGSTIARYMNIIETQRRTAFILKDSLNSCVSSSGKLAAAAYAKMGSGATPVTESENDLNMIKSKGESPSLPKHSYWFDFWAFVVFDIVFFLFIYFIVP